MQLLPELQEANLYNSYAKAYGYTGDGNPLSLTVPIDELFKIAGTPVALYYCPTRRAPAAYPGQLETLNQTGQWGPVAKMDYGLNWGTAYPHPPPPADARNFGPRQGIAQFDNPILVSQNPSINLVATVRSRDVTDGLSKTYLVGETSILSGYYENPTSSVHGTQEVILDMFQCAGIGARTADNSPMRDPNSISWEDVLPSFGDINRAVPFGSAAPQHLEHGVLRWLGPCDVLQHQLRHAFRTCQSCRRRDAGPEGILSGFSLPWRPSAGQRRCC